MKGTPKAEIICHTVAISLITLLYIILGFAVIFGPAEIRLAREWNTIGIALTAGIVTWVFYCLLSFIFFRGIFMVTGILKNRKLATRRRWTTGYPRLVGSLNDPKSK